MADLQDLLDDLNDRLGDANNAAGAGLVAKTRWINYGINAMWPKIYKDVEDEIELVADTYEYAIDGSFNNGQIYRVSVEDTYGRFITTDGYVVDKRRDLFLSFPRLPGLVGNTVRVQGVARISPLALVTDVYDGTSSSEELPVLYAMGISANRRTDKRLDYERAATTTAQNGVDINEVMNASQFWFAQFELLLQRLEMPWPVSGLGNG